MTIEQIDRPRILHGFGRADRPESPPYGTFYLDLGVDALEQYLGPDGGWQIVGGGDGYAPVSDQNLEAPPFAAFNAAAAEQASVGATGFGNASGGGGGVSPAPTIQGVDPGLTTNLPSPGVVAVGFGARIIGTPSESIAHNVDQEPTWQTGAITGCFDDAGFVIAAAGTHRFQIPAGKAGLYRLTCQIALDPTGTSQQRGRVSITTPVFTIFAEDTQTPAVAQVCTWRSQVLTRLSVGDVVSFTFLQTNSGGLAKILTASAAQMPGRCYAEIEFMGT